ncbi:hypothetical protein [Polyangium spumosum]|uniref:Uncharacterized protein n=1 Tax=Polyangium spumosum TaxID=889282 RepID=A0A6N7PSU9_9BACT|nr:hypothetical protein [Polyangium spumosum]MRG94999.1 hypothetical protein [Polyangium spumosum]
MSPERSRQRARLPVTNVAGPAPRQSLAPLETCGPDDRFHDYILAEYEPIAPALGKLRSLNVLVESFAIAGVEREGLALLSAVRAGLGPFRTVWGIKRHHAHGELGWELYFYDFQRAHADLSIARVAAILAPHLRVTGREPRPLPWHMFSVELGPAGLLEGAPSAIDIYIDMRSYKCVADELVFENVYTFHDARAEIEEVLHRVRSCVHFDPSRDALHRLMPAHLFNCRKICVANKRHADAMYFSRIPTPALSRFLRDHQWPGALQDFVRTRDEALGHLLWDVGIDFRAIDGRATTIKSGIYGSF